MADMNDLKSLTLSQLKDRYCEIRSWANTAELDDLDFRPDAEIAAAVQSFIGNRESREGVYVYFDIGAGTLDGVSFRYKRDDGIPRVLFYAGSVKTLGVSYLAECIQPESPLEIEQALLDKKVLPDTVIDVLVEKTQEIRALVSHVVLEAKRSDIRRDWLGSDNRFPVGTQGEFGGISKRDGITLPIFIGGGGMHSPYYKDSIVSTYLDRQLNNHHIPRFELSEVPVPSSLDLTLNKIPPKEFHRFAIAYGLSIPVGEAPEVGLPSQAPEAEKQPSRSPGVAYEDTKDAYT